MGGPSNSKPAKRAHRIVQRNDLVENDDLFGRLVANALSGKVDQLGCSGRLGTTDDDAFTYNHEVNRLSAIQEHFMLMQAVKNGVSEEAMAAALNVDVASIRKKQNLLVGICPEAVELLKGKLATAGAFRQMREVKPMREIEMAELMCASNKYSVDYAKCLVAATRQEQLVESDHSKEIDRLSPADVARMEREMESLSRDFKKRLRPLTWSSVFSMAAPWSNTELLSCSRLPLPICHSETNWR